MALEGLSAFSRGRGQEGRGRGRGQEGRGRGRGQEGRGRGRGRSQDRGYRELGGSGVSRSSNSDRGRGRGGWFGLSDEEQAEILTTRLVTMHISSEGTDDFIVPTTAGAQIGLAMQVLRREGLEALQAPLQIRMFLQSCLLNLSNHHSVDTSGILLGLASETGLAKLRHIMMQSASVNSSNRTTSLTVSFQTVTLPLIGVLTRQSLCQTTLRRESNLVYGLVQELCQQFLGLHVLPSVSKLMDRTLVQTCSSTTSILTCFPQPSAQSHQQNHHQRDSFQSMAPLHCTLLAIVRLIYQLVMRFPESITKTAPVTRTLGGLVDRCRQQSKTGNAKQVFLNSTLDTEMNRLSTSIQDKTSELRGLREQPLQINLSSLPSQLTDGPGALALHGPRNDNDHSMISRIDILPTRDEVLCKTNPFLPINDYKESSTHFLPRGWSRHLDVHFRLYRQDMMNPLCAGIQAFIHLLQSTDRRADQDFVDPKELRRRINDNVSLNVYSNVKFLDVAVNGSQAGLTKISFNQPTKAQGINRDDRRQFWERSRGLLMQGGLVCFVRRYETRDYCRHQVALAVVQERDIQQLSNLEHIAHIHVSLSDPASYTALFTPLYSSSSRSSSEKWFMIECPGTFFESFRPVLKAIQASRPSALPFGKYIAPTDEEIDQFSHVSAAGVIDPPLYTSAPGFEYDLSVLLENGGVLELNLRDPQSADQAVAVLRERSSLDNTQALALVQTLGREIALISGPPGTGKTKIGIDLMRVLLHNKQTMTCGPIVVICYTNHALDQFLEHLLDNGYTKIARLGGQSKSERLQDYSLRVMMDKHKKPYAARQAIAEAFQAAKSAALSIRSLTRALKSDYFDWSQVREYLIFENPAQCRQFEDSPPGPIMWDDGAIEAPLRRFMTSKVAYERWATGKDLDEKRVWNRHVDKKEKEEARSTNIFDALDEAAPKSVMTPRYDIPVSDRPVPSLGGDVWSMSMKERRRLIEYWSPDIIRSIEEDLGQHHLCLESAKESKLCGYDELRRLILSDMDVIGMTTSGSAKFQALLESVAPKIILCEEAGEVLESHILSALSPTTQHLILIGDHLQLRPQVQTYDLSSESSVGKKYNLDKSLFERLVTSDVNPLPMSHLTIQRRMRPEISSLIRNTLYPALEDGGLVCQYPDVGGMGSNLFFMDHRHPEDKKDPFGQQSFSNTFEIQMIEALAVYLIKNGYNQPGDIAILTPYLGQLSKIRDQLKDRFVVLVDERDEERLDAGAIRGDTEAPPKTKPNMDAQQTKVILQNHITIRTIDNYQGEEAKIVLISLVRSDTNTIDETSTGSIGFLKSPNRTNVLLSRAQHGMFLIGNARLMAQPKHGLWPDIMKELGLSDRIGQGYPIACKNHPETKRIVCSADDLQAAAPDGGCTLPCGEVMSCGHHCPRSCHPDDLGHILVKCTSTCKRPRSDCEHVCQKLCWKDCGKCNVVVSPLTLPCGHSLQHPKCWQLSDLTKVACTAKVERTLTYCGHTHTMMCHQGPANVSCLEKRQSILECGHSCDSICHGTSPCVSCSKKCLESCAHTTCGHEDLPCDH